MPLPKPCVRCGVRFERTGRSQKLCPKCWRESQRNNRRNTVQTKLIMEVKK